MHVPKWLQQSGLLHSRDWKWRKRASKGSTSRALTLFYCDFLCSACSLCVNFDSFTSCPPGFKVTSCSQEERTSDFKIRDVFLQSNRASIGYISCANDVCRGLDMMSPPKVHVLKHDLHCDNTERCWDFEEVGLSGND